MRIETRSFWYKGYCPSCTRIVQLSEMYAEKRKERQQAREADAWDHNFRAAVLWFVIVFISAFFAVSLLGFV
jgi:hypothetical protein